MNLIKLIKEYGTRFSVILTVIALMLFVPAGLAKSPVLMAILIVLILLLLGGAILVLVLAKKQHLGDINYFLYDEKTGKSIAKESLDERVFRARMARYLHAHGVSTLSLWDGFPESLREKLSEEPQYRPLVAYSMLLALSACPDRHVPVAFAHADVRAVSYICHALSEAGDKELADYIYGLKKNESANAALVTPFFKKNGPRFTSRAMRYLNTHFDAFYVDKSYFAK